MRAFIAVELPGEVKDKLEKFSKSIGVDGLVPVKREAMHITLQFLGEIREDEIEKVESAMEMTKTGAIGVEVNGIYYFSPELIKVVFACVRNGNEELVGLYKKLSSNLASNGVSIKRERDYTPHITLFRVKKPKNMSALSNAISKNKGIKFGSFTAKSIVLKKSVLSSSGPTYTTLHISEI